MMDSYIVSPPPVATRRPPRRRRWLVALIIVAALAVGLVMLHPWNRGPRRAKTADDANAPAAVTIVHAARGDVPVRLQELGTVTPLVTVTVKSQISGYLTAIAFHEGQDVKRGDFLVQVDPRPYQAVLEQYQGNLIRDQALLRNAQLDLTRYQHLARLDSIAQQTMDTELATVAQYQGAVKTDQGLIDAEQLDLDYAHIVAPSDGRVGLRQVDVGNYVTPGDANGIVVLTQLQPISVIFTIPQTALTPVLARLRHTTLDVTALDPDDAAVVGRGTVETIDNQIDTTTGTVKLRALFANADETLFPNQFVNVSLLVDTVRNQILVPNEAVQRGTQGTYVFAVDAKNTVTLRPVTTGISADGRTVVTSGLAVGDAVVVEGTSRLREGAKVTIVPSAPTAGAAGGAGATP